MVIYGNNINAASQKFQALSRTGNLDVHNI